MTVTNPGALPPVLFLADHFGYADGVVHGATTYFLHLLPALAAAGLAVTACFLREPHPAARPLEGTGVEPIFLGAARRDPRVLREVIGLARTRRCGLVHATGFKGALAGRLAARAVRAPAIVHVHDLAMPPGGARLLHGLVAAPRDSALCVSRAAVAVAAAGYRIPPSRARVVGTGLRIEDFAAPPGCRALVRRGLGIPPDAPLLAMLARFHPVKGHRAMIRMMREIVACRPQARLLLAGDGPERPACEALAADLGLAARVHFLGNRGDVAPLLAASDLLVMPSESEGLGRAVIEAHLAGVPTVAFDTGGLAEASGEAACGRLAPAGDTRAFVAAILETLADVSLHSEPLRQRRRELAARRFGIEAHVARLLEAYAEALQPAAAATRATAR